LEQKYEALVALRTRREEREAQGHGGVSEAEGQLRRAAFRVVARNFPGALRELEKTTCAALEVKLAAIPDELARLRRGETIARRWVGVMIDFHATLRETLAVKLWLARRLGRDGTIGADDVTAFLAWHAELAEHGAMCPAHGTDVAGDLRSHLHPPGGRV